MRFGPVVWALVATTGLAIAATAAGPGGGADAARVGYEWMRQVEWIDRAPLGADQARGRVLVVEFWAAECINCRRTAPAMRALAERYAHDPRVLVIGVHSPELEVERRVDTVRRAMAEQGVTFPVAQDGAGAAWNAFHNRYWPALYVVDGAGRVRATHVGELHVDSPAWGAFLQRIDAVRSERS
ncbi:MAG TPA: redoxin domain-containing protein [Candidatus Saccharimonadaceae bacterium]|jgi:thiol-disulfide isomerase/thioredoxin|nr:redoxin domain-containing protein [Candidatus Saccharimonadaceae bacterium]